MKTQFSLKLPEQPSLLNQINNKPTKNKPQKPIKNTTNKAEDKEKSKEQQFDFKLIAVNAKGEITQRERKQARSQTENLDDGVILEMVTIPGGTVMMGSLQTEKDRKSDDREGPQHKVILKPFYMSKYPITQAQWQAVIGGNNPSHFKGDKHPVEKVSWKEALKFCQQLSKMTGQEYRLPSEAEWEYACRAGTRTPFHFGEMMTTELANYDGNYTYRSEPKGVYRQKTTEVGSFPSSAFDLYDMHGNVWEWCADTWHNNYEGAPSDGSVWENGGESSTRLLRGGAWGSLPSNCRSASRSRAEADSKSYVIGFRVALGIEQIRESKIYLGCPDKPCR